ncbi:putative Kinase-like domain-containing protein [Seiridium cardinale]|uniref:Kinase-like domain-containing protein n=1 Tax=Seiridium cardinale TaxID=138064 RepID=A0ABR2XY29_9PEZI
MMWWDAAHIEQTVTRQFVASHLQPGNVDSLDNTLGFGDGLTDETYWDWIEGKAKRIFLILVDVGIPDQIFGVVDHSWDDDDLPFSLIDAERVTAKKDHKLNWKFWDRQYYYILREIEEGSHMVFGDDEVVPIDVVDKKSGPSLSQNHHVDKVSLPHTPGQVFSRWRLSASNIPQGTSHEDFLKEVRGTRDFRNEHIAYYYASYTHLDHIYVLTTFPSEYNLKSLVTNSPAAFKALSKQDRNTRVLNWIHCLADALCYLHGRGRAHGNIKPSSIVFDSGHRIILADVSNSKIEALTNAPERTAFDKESYDHAAPEQWFRPANSNVLYSKSSLTSPTPSHGNYTFSIHRGGGDRDPLHPSTPHLDPQAADVFSLGCITLELLSLLLKRSSKSFAAHRGAKHKLAGRGGAPLDTSFHKNLGQVESWMASLAKDASKKDDPIFRGVSPMLQVVARMLSTSPPDRPTARAIEKEMYRILTEYCLITEPHCVHQYEGSDLGLDGLRIRADANAPISITTKRQSEHRRSHSDGKRPLSPRDSALQFMRRSQQVMQNPRASSAQYWDAAIHT